MSESLRSTASAKGLAVKIRSHLERALPASKFSPVAKNHFDFAFNRKRYRVIVHEVVEEET